MPDTHKEQVAALIRITNIISYLPLDLQEIFRVVGRELAGLFPPYEPHFILACEQLDFQPETPLVGSIRCLTSDNRESCRTLKAQLPVLVYDTKKGACLCSLNSDIQSHICVPLISGSEVFGTLSLRSNKNLKLSRDQLELLLAIANQTSATIQRAKLVNGLGREKDRLTRANHNIAALNQNLKNTIRQLKTTQDQLILSERLAAAGYLAANFAHEVNNPTGIILSRLECLELEADELTLPETVRKDLAVIKKHANRIARITRGLLSFSRDSRKTAAPLAINELILETVDWLEDQFVRKGVQFSLELGDLPLLRGSREQLQQVLVNLLTNARDALPEGGQITITTGVNQEGRAIFINIYDNGIGIPTAHLSKIFDPFFTTKEVGKGTGLGLAISYNLVQEHGGVITVDSKEGQGTTFSIRLPLDFEGDQS